MFIPLGRNRSSKASPPAGANKTGAQQSSENLGEQGFTWSRNKPRKRYVQWARHGNNNNKGVVVVVVLCMCFPDKEPWKYKQEVLGYMPGCWSRLAGSPQMTPVGPGRPAHRKAKTPGCYLQVAQPGLAVIMFCLPSLQPHGGILVQSLILNCLERTESGISIFSLHRATRAATAPRSLLAAFLSLADWLTGSGHSTQSRGEAAA